MNQLQHFEWSTNSNDIIVSSYGTIFGVNVTGSECEIYGIYKFNDRFKVKIKIIVV